MPTTDDPPMVGVRPQRPQDAAAVTAVRLAVAAEARRHRGGDVVAARIEAGRPDDGPVGGTAGDRVTDATVELTVVGTIGDVVVGSLTARLRPGEEGGTTCDITFIGVEPPARGVGVGAALVRAARSWAVEHGASSLDAAALPGDRSTKNFFEAHGLVARLIVVRSPLP